jgi:hypothetical protein
MMGELIELAETVGFLVYDQGQNSERLDCFDANTTTQSVTTVCITVKHLLRLRHEMFYPTLHGR